jgi:membrane protein YqaA with SNARE-associated domain
LSEIALPKRLTLLLDESSLNRIQRWLWVLSTGGTVLDGYVIFVLGRDRKWIRRRRRETRRNVWRLPSANLKEKFGVPSVLGIVSAVSLLGLVITLILGREDTE